MKLTFDNVLSTFMDCLYDDDEIADVDREILIAKSIVVEGICGKVGFNPEKIDKHKDNIKSMLSCLPTEFMYDGGGGFSFLNAGIDKDGNQWTGLHKSMDELFTLGQAIKLVRLCLDRELWSMLPGSMPYYVVKLDGFKEIPLSI